MIREALGVEKLHRGYDVVCANSSCQTICELLELDGNVMLVLLGEYERIPTSVHKMVLNSSTSLIITFLNRQYLEIHFFLVPAFAVIQPNDDKSES